MTETVDDLIKQIDQEVGQLSPKRRDYLLAKAEQDCLKEGHLAHLRALRAYREDRYLRSPKRG